MTFKGSLALRLTTWFLILSLYPLAVVAIFVLDNVGRGLDDLTIYYRTRQSELLATTLSHLPKAESDGFVEILSQNDAFVVGPNGRYLRHPNQNKIAAPMSDDFSTETVEQVLAGKAGARIDHDTRRIIGFAPIPAGNRFVVTVSDGSRASALMSSLTRSSQIQLAASLFIVSMAGGVAIWIVVGKPVRQLTKAAEKVGQGNLKVEVDPEDTADELQVLAVTFNQMTVQLRELIQGLEQKVDELEKAESTIRESAARFRALIENAQDIITVLDASGTIRFGSPALDRVLGYKPEEVLGSDVFDFIHPEDRAGAREIFEQSAQELQASPRIELRLKHRDGSWRHLEAIGHSLLQEPLIQGMVINARDVTERKKLEEQLRQSQKMEAIGRLAGGIAHDFNNILTVISGHSELLLKSGADERQRREIEQIRQASEQATSLTRQLLAFSRKQVLQPETLDLNQTVAHLEKMLPRLIGEDIDMEVVLSEDLGHVRADPSQIQQVVLNLAVNARDAMPDGGKLTFETANLEMDEADARRHAGVTPGRYVMLAVSDTGEGIDRETKARIFEPFYTTKEMGKGTGLGLATVHGIVTQSGGHIRVESEPGHGTTFRIYLPRLEETEALARDRVVSVPRAGVGSETILVVEDEKMIRDLSYDVLSHQGYTVLLAGDAEEASRFARQHRGPIHLLLTDMVIPSGSGRQLADQLTALRDELKVLYMSGYTDNALGHHGVVGRDIMFLPKPFTPQSLIQKVRETLDAG